METTMTGVKGSDVYTADGVGNPLVALSALLVRGAAPSTIHDGVEAVLSTSDQALIEDLMVLTFQTRDIRGGKGERAVTELLLKNLLTKPQTLGLTLDLLDLLPEYGCWKDLFKLTLPFSWSRVLDIVQKQFSKDEQALLEFHGDPSKPLKLSLLAKWLPREGQPDVTTVVCKLVPGHMFWGSRMKQYRQRVSALNKALKTVEVQMCSGAWDTIVPGSVPGRAGKKYSRAFLNLPGTKSKGELSREGLRHPDDPVRMACRENFMEHFSKTAKGEVKAKGADTLFPNEVVKKAWSLSRATEVSEDEKNHLRGVWCAMVEAAREGGGLGRSLAMCDFSGSMGNNGSNANSPYWVSAALGLLISEVTTEEFKDTFLTFDSRPKFHTLSSGDIFQRLASINGTIGQGTSTDFQKAMDLVLARLKQSRARPGQEPENLIVLTDMAWDQACSSSESSVYTGNTYRHNVKTAPWQTHVEMIRESFKRAGEDMWGEGNGWKMPTIVIWNLAATCADFHAKADTEGVVMLSGWSPSLFKVLQAKGVVQMTPMDALRIQLDDPRYDLVRARVKAFFEKSA